MKFKTLLFILAALVATTSLYAAGKKTRVYVYGFAASFNDSIVYFTDIQTLDSATIASNQVSCTDAIIIRISYATI